MSTAIVVLELLFTFVPYLLDTGVQIWNAVQVNSLTANTEFKYPTPLLLNEYYEVNTEQCEDDWTYFSHTKLCYKFSVAKATLQLQMSVCLSVCLSVTETPQPLRIAPIDHQAYRPSSLLTIEPIEH